MVHPVSISPIQVSDDVLKSLHTATPQNRYTALEELFLQCYAKKPSHLSRAGGRINLIGEHVDYPQSQFSGSSPAHLFSMGGAVEQEYIIAITFTEDSKIKCAQADINEYFEIALDELGEYELKAQEEREASKPMKDRVLPPWAYHTLGGISEALQHGGALKGVEIAVSSTVPYGAGMSNSAANLVALGLVLNAAFPALDLGDKMDLATFARNAENGAFVGGHCGFLDQLLICYSQAGKLTKIDYASKSIEHFNSQLPTTMQFLTFNTNVPHVLAESDYPTRVKELEEIHALLSEVLQVEFNSTYLSLNSINALLKQFAVAEIRIKGMEDRGVELTAAEIDRLVVFLKKQKKPSLLLRRLRHQKASSLMVPLAGNAAEHGDVETFGRLLNAEGASLRMSGDFQITGKNGAQDALLDCGFDAGGELGIKVFGRMLGGGGGGNVLFFVDKSNDVVYEQWKTKTAALYADWTRANLTAELEATVIEPVIAQGAELLR